MDRRAVRRPPRWAAAWPKGGCSGRPLQGANNGARWREAGGTRRWFCGRPRPAVLGLAAPHFTPRRPRTRLCGAGNTPQPPSPHLLPRRAVAAPSLPRQARGAQLERVPGLGATRGAKARGPRLGRAGAQRGTPVRWPGAAIADIGGTPARRRERVLRVHDAGGRQVPGQGAWTPAGWPERRGPGAQPGSALESRGATKGVAVSSAEPPGPVLPLQAQAASRVAALPRTHQPGGLRAPRGRTGLHVPAPLDRAPPAAEPREFGAAGVERTAAAATVARGESQLRSPAPPRAWGERAPQAPPLGSPTPRLRPRDPGSSTVPPYMPRLDSPGMRSYHTHPRAPALPAPLPAALFVVPPRDPTFRGTDGCGSGLTRGGKEGAVGSGSPKALKPFAGGRRPLGKASQVFTHRFLRTRWLPCSCSLGRVN